MELYIGFTDILTLLITIIICLSNKLNSSNDYEWFQSYCMNVYECEHGILSNKPINYLCVSCQKKCLRRIFSLPYNTQCYLLPLLCQYSSH